MAMHTRPYTDQTVLPFQCKERRTGRKCTNLQPYGRRVRSWGQEKKCVFLLTIPTGKRGDPDLQTQTCTGLKVDLYLKEVDPARTFVGDCWDQSGEEIFTKPRYARHATERKLWPPDASGAVRKFQCKARSERQFGSDTRNGSYGSSAPPTKRPRRGVSRITQWSTDSSLATWLLHQC